MLPRQLFREQSESIEKVDIHSSGLGFNREWQAMLGHKEERFMQCTAE